MALYVDKIVYTPKWKYPYGCHLFADTIEELHLFAKQLGLKQNWFQKQGLPHYDLTINKRKLAVKLGAIEVKLKEYIKKTREDN